MTNDAITQPTALAGLLDYQPGSVVSRVLFRNSGGVLTLFAFAAGEGLTEHATPHDATVLILDGAVDITLAGTKQRVAAGEILHLPASVPHALESDVAFKMLLTILKNPTGE